MELKNLNELKIGTVEYVSPNEIKVLLELDAPQSVALNTGIPTPFPKINSYALIPNQIGAIVGVISWIGIERAPFPKRKGLKDFGLIDLPYPLRKMAITPVGTLKVSLTKEEKYIYKLDRGVSIFPSVGDTVVLPNQEQQVAIIEKSDIKAKVYIGTAPLAGNAKVFIDPDKLFARHLAILGNTGSGKSCSVAGLIRWSIEEANKIVEKDNKVLNGRFLILDPNGEYYKAFPDYSDKIRQFKISLAEGTPADGVEHSLKIPAWMWNSAEWCTFSQAAPGAQRPLLIEALRGMRLGGQLDDPIVIRLRRFLIGHKKIFEGWLALPPSQMQWRDRMNCGHKLQVLGEDTQSYINSQDLTQAIKDKLNVLMTEANTLRQNKEFTYNNAPAYNEFSETDIGGVVSKLNEALQCLPQQTESLEITADTPKFFNVEHLPEYLDNIASSQTGRDIAQFIGTLTMRIRMMLADNRLRNVVSPEKQITLEEWLKEYIGDDNASNGQIALLDLSLIPSDVLHLVIAVMSRLIFEALQRYRKKYEKELPTVLVLEEAHAFVNRTGDIVEASLGQICCQTFERIAREGRKFGLSLVLASQRPSEISSTVLAQCNTFLLHRIVNDRDQELVRRLVPDTIGSLLRELPTLPTRQAILLGWATPIPVLLEMRELPDDQRPHSEDPRFWDVWTGKEKREIDWKAIAEDWQKTDNPGTTDTAEET